MDGSPRGELLARRNALLMQLRRLHEDAVGAALEHQPGMIPSGKLKRMQGQQQLQKVGEDVEDIIFGAGQSLPIEQQHQSEGQLVVGNRFLVAANNEWKARVEREAEMKAEDAWYNNAERMQLSNSKTHDGPECGQHWGPAEKDAFLLQQNIEMETRERVEKDTRARVERETRERVEKETREQVGQEVRERLEQVARETLAKEVDNVRRRLAEDARHRDEEAVLLQQKIEMETRERVEKDTRERVERETRGRVEKETREQVGREVRECLEQEARERLARIAETYERQAREKVDRENRENLEREMRARFDQEMHKQFVAVIEQHRKLAEDEARRRYELETILLRETVEREIRDQVEQKILKQQARKADEDERRILVAKEETWRRSQSLAVKLMHEAARRLLLRKAWVQWAVFSEGVRQKLARCRLGGDLPGATDNVARRSSSYRVFTEKCATMDKWSKGMDSLQQQLAVMAIHSMENDVEEEGAEGHLLADFPTFVENHLEHHQDHHRHHYNRNDEAFKPCDLDVSRRLIDPLGTSSEPVNASVRIPCRSLPQISPLTPPVSNSKTSAQLKQSYPILYCVPKNESDEHQSTSFRSGSPDLPTVVGIKRCSSEGLTSPTLELAQLPPSLHRPPSPQPPPSAEHPQPPSPQRPQLNIAKTKTILEKTTILCFVAAAVSAQVGDQYSFEN